MNNKLSYLLKNVINITDNVNKYNNKKWLYKINNNYCEVVNLFFDNVLVASFYIDIDNNLVYHLYDLYYHNTYDHTTLSSIINVSNAKEFNY